MTATNRLSKLVKATAKLPKGIRSTLWSKAFGRIVPMVGSANIRYLEVSHAKVVVKIETIVQCKTILDKFMPVLWH